MDKRLMLQLNANRKISGVLRGYDAFMNIVLDETFEETVGERKAVGMVVIRGNSIVMMEVLDRIH